MGTPATPRTRKRASGAPRAQRVRVLLRGEVTVHDPVALLRALADELEDGELGVESMRYTRRDHVQGQDDNVSLPDTLFAWEGHGPVLEVRFKQSRRRPNATRSA